jgi:hypothetical protein
VIAVWYMTVIGNKPDVGFYFVLGGMTGQLHLLVGEHAFVAKSLRDHPG